MIVRYLDEIVETENDVKSETWRSRRLLLKQDGLGYSLHDTIIKANTETFIWYKNHIEAVYCVEGEGEIEEVDTGKVHQIRDGMLYVLNNHDKHLLRGHTDMRLICVFTPALTGHEVHDADGSYPLGEE